MREWLFALAVAVLAALLILVGWWMRGVVEAYHVAIPTPIVVEAAEPVPPPPCLDYWIVGPGDTLWNIARRCYPGEHTGQMVAEIRAENPGVDPGRLRVGQTLRLPVVTEIAGGVE